MESSQSSRHTVSFIRLLINTEPRLTISIQQRRIPILHPIPRPRAKRVTLPELKPPNRERQSPAAALWAASGETLRAIERLFELAQHKVQMNQALTISTNLAQPLIIQTYKLTIMKFVPYVPKITPLS
jgi:hypothetical protein